MANRVGPLNWNVPIVNKDGTPTKEFMQKWIIQGVANGTIPALGTPAEVSAVLDVLAGTRGDILERGVTQWGGRSSPSDATKFLNGALDPDYARVKDTDLAVTDVTGNNVLSTAHGFAPKAPADATKFLNGAATPTYALVKDSDLSTSDITTNNVVSTKHGFAPKSPGNAAMFLNGGATPAWSVATVADADVTFTDITTGNVSITKHGFAPKLPNDATKYLDGSGAYTVPPGTSTGLPSQATHGGQFLTTDGSTASWVAVTVSDADVTFTDITTNNVTSTKHGYAPKAPADATKFLNGAATPAYAQVKDSDLSTSDITTNNVSTSKHGFAPKASNVATEYLDGTGNYSTPSGTATTHNVYSWASPSMTTVGSALFASEGMLVIPFKTFTIDRLFFTVSPNAISDVYGACIVTVDSARAITGTVATATRVTIAATGAQTIEMVFSSPVTLTAGTAYGLVCVITSGATNKTTKIYEVTATGLLPGLPLDAGAMIATYSAEVQLVRWLSNSDTPTSVASGGSSGSVICSIGVRAQI